MPAFQKVHFFLIENAELFENRRIHEMEVHEINYLWSSQFLIHEMGVHGKDYLWTSPFHIHEMGVHGKNYQWSSPFFVFFTDKFK